MNLSNQSSEMDPLRRLKWQCRRGLLELDILFDHFLQTQYKTLSEEQKTKFVKLLEYSDQQLLHWLTEQDPPPANLVDIIEILKYLNHSEKETNYPYVTAYISLGSNLNKPIEQLKTAIRSIQQIPQSRFIAVSSFYQTAPIGLTEQPNFINAVICLETQLTAKILLLTLQKIENTQGRFRGPEKNGPRSLDLDLLLYDKQVITESDLVIPHPHLEERAFVLIPLIEIAPQFTLPNGKTIQDCLLKLGDTSHLVAVIA